jgi:transcription factor SFP1
MSPDTSVPGTPAGEMDDDYANMPMNMNMGNMNMNMGNMNFPFGMGSDSLGLDLCIDEPAKRLYSPNGYTNQRLQQQFAQFGLGQGQFANNNDLVRAYRQQQMMAMNAMGNPQAAAAMMMGEEHKPFRCPVIGCEKAYKNQNGLKYVPLPTYYGKMLTVLGITKHMAIKLSNYTRTGMEHSQS